VASELRVLPDGALDALNDAAFEKCNEPLCEGDDPITFNPRAMEALLS
jgi:hypothetical protein